MIATYRLQLTPTFGFDEARAILPYLQRLGVSHIYLSPITESRAGSIHGYDVIDHNRIREELGGEEGFERLRETCVAAGLGIILDFVPNHAGVGADNEAWQDVLAFGRYSPEARRFDLDWSPIKPELEAKLLLPFLGRPYGEALDEGELALVHEDGRLACAYFDHRFALAPRSYALVLEKLEGPSARDLAAGFRHLAPGDRDEAESLLARFREISSRDLAPALEAFRGPGLHGLLEAQNWRLAYWKVSGYEINYRRFFDINDLVGLRMEDRAVFEASHRLLADLLRRDGVDGVRIDHVDGLSDPDGYLEGLAEIASRGAAGAWIEKILAHGEVPPESWPIEGTTGYEFMNDVLHLLLWPEAEISIDRLYRRFVGEREDASFADMLHRSKHVVIATRLSGELFRLAYELDRLSEADYHTRDFTLEALREALAEVVCSFPRYRTYLPRHAGEEATGVVLEAVYDARRRNPAFEPSVFDFVGRALLEPMKPGLEPARRAWVGRFQQYTAPVAAKGEEDTAFYRYARFVALNEVGGSPERFGHGPEVFHSHARFRAHRYPRALLATATHDHKRGEDTRMRLLALSEIPDRYARAVRSLRAAVRRHRGEHGPSPNDAYFLIQTLLALWDSAPEEELIDRLSAYAVKAAREAKLQSSWVAPNEEYEADLAAFIRGMVTDRRVRRILTPVAGEIARLGFQAGISQLLLKLTSPGIPDLYQGTELLDLSLVDPDNRRAVDYYLRQRLLDVLEPLLRSPTPETIREIGDGADPRFKLYLLARLLRFRARAPACFEGPYRELTPEGPAAAATIAFERTPVPAGSEDAAAPERLIVIVPRWFASTPAEARTATEIDLAPEPGSPPDERTVFVDLITGARIETGPRLSLAHLPLPWAVLYTPAAFP